MTNPDDKTIPDQPMISLALMAIAVGIIAGFGAVGFRLLIGLVHNLLFLGQFSFIYDANEHTPFSVWGIGVILVPVIGALGVTFLVTTFAPDAKGHGVPEVIDAIYYQQGKIRPIVAAIKSLASALSIGSGGSVGREGPIIQIGAAFGSTLGQYIRMPLWQRTTLIAAGAGAGIGATFNTPIGGLAFAIELMLPEIKARTVLPVTLAVAVATYIGRYFLGTMPAFNIPALTVPDQHIANPSILPFFIVFGVAIGLISALFIWALYWSEDQFELRFKNPYIRHVLGMLTFGIIIYLMARQTGYYYIQGVGYATIEDILAGRLTGGMFLLLLVGLKLLATCLTLGSGASGGVFSPGLFMGAALGGAIGGIVQWLFPDWGLNPALFAVAGMAGMIGSMTGAVITGITMLFEMTRDLNAILPMLLTVTVAYAVRQRIMPPTIYTLKLLRRGHNAPQGLQAAIGDSGIVMPNPAEEPPAADKDGSSGSTTLKMPQG